MGILLVLPQRHDPSKKSWLVVWNNCEIPRKYAADAKEKDLSCKQRNKQRFINMIAAKLKADGCDVYHADADADLVIVQKGIEVSLEAETMGIGEDTDLLVLLIYHANKESRKIYFYSEPKQNARCVNIWDIK